LWTQRLFPPRILVRLGPPLCGISIPSIGNPRFVLPCTVFPRSWGSSLVVSFMAGHPFLLWVLPFLGGSVVSLGPFPLSPNLCFLVSVSHQLDDRVSSPFHLGLSVDVLSEDRGPTLLPS